MTKKYYQMMEGTGGGETYLETISRTSKAIDDLTNSGLYWKQRCLAAEMLLDSVDNNINKRFVGWKEWQDLKNTNPQNYKP